MGIHCRKLWLLWIAPYYYSQPSYINKSNFGSAALPSSWRNSPVGKQTRLLIFCAGSNPWFRTDGTPHVCFDHYSIPQLVGCGCLPYKMAVSHIKWVGPPKIWNFSTHGHAWEALSQLWSNGTRPKNINLKIWSHRSDRNHEIFNSMRSESWLRPLCWRPILLKILPLTISEYNW